MPHKNRLSAGLHPLRGMRSGRKGSLIFTLTAGRAKMSDRKQRKGMGEFYGNDL